MDLLKAISAFNLVKDLKLSDSTEKLSTVLDMVGFGKEESSQLIDAARRVASSEDMKILDFINAKGFGSAMNMLLKRSDSADARRFGDYMALADLSTSASQESFVQAFGAVGIDPQTAVTLKELISKNAKPSESLSQFVKTPGFAKVLHTLRYGEIPPTAGIIKCPHCEGYIQP